MDFPGPASRHTARYFNGVHENVEDVLKRIDQGGGPQTYPHMAAGSAVGFDAPFGWMKQVPSDFGGTATLFVNNEKVSSGRIEHTQAGIFSADETADVGIDLGTPVVEAIGSNAESKFTGRIPKVTIEVHPVAAKAASAAREARNDALRYREQADAALTPFTCWADRLW